MHSSQVVWIINNSVFNGTDAVHLRPIQSVHNASTRLIVKKQKYDQITATIRDELHWLPVQQRLDYKLCNFIYKCFHQSAPCTMVYISSVCTRVGKIEGRRYLCSAARGDLVVLRTNNKMYGPCSFAVAGSSVLNSIQLVTRDFDLTMPAHHKLLTTELFR